MNRLHYTHVAHMDRTVIKSAEEFIELRLSEEREDYWRAAHEALDDHVWYDLIEHYPDMRKWVAYHKAVPLEVLSILVHDEDPQVRSFVAMKNKLTEELLIILARDTQDSIRLHVARHKHATREVLELLSRDSWRSICDLVAQRLSAQNYTHTVKTTS